MAIDVPADARFLQVLRVAAAAACAEALGDYQRVDDLRLAIDELAAAAITSADDDGRLHVEVWTTGDAVHVHGRVPADGRDPALGEIGTMLLSSVSRQHRIARVGDDVVFELVVALGRVG